MTDDGPRGRGDERSWHDRDTEPIPRARHDGLADDENDHEPRDSGLHDVFDEHDDEVHYHDAFPGRYENEYPEEFDDPSGGQLSGGSTVGASFVVGDPITEEELGGLRGGTTPLVTSRRVVPLEDEASPLVQRYLFPTEKFRGEWRRHWIALLREIGIAAGATVALGLLAGYLARIQAAPEIAGFMVFGWFIVLVWVAWQVVDWWYDRFILTNKRVMVVSGVITRNVAMMPLQRVTDMKYVQNAVGRVLNYGTFELESAGQDQALRSIPYLPSPNELYLRIVEEMYEPEAVEARLAGAPDTITDGT
jgi:membrane protein YdbS with pleckstrin-like domain